jgi:hypothetical protein
MEDHRNLMLSDVLLSNGVHGDNCATVIVGDKQDVDQGGVRLARGTFTRWISDNKEDEAKMVYLVQAARESVSIRCNRSMPARRLP